MEHKKERIEYIDILRGIAIILMVMGHVDFGTAFDHYIHAFHMPIWFFISGWLFKQPKSLGTALVKKTKTLLLPYFVFGILQYPVWILFNRSAEDMLEPIKNLFWVNTNLVMPIAGALWFLTCLFFVEMIFTVLLRLASSEIIRFICVCGIVAVGIVLSVCGIRLPWAVDVSLISVGFMYIGYILKKNLNYKYIKKIFELPVLLVIPLFLVNLICSMLNGYVNLRIGEYANIALFWFNAICATVVYWNIAKKIWSAKRFPKTIINWLKSIGRNSIVYLVLNQLFVTVFDRVFLKILGADTLKSIAVRIIVFIITMVCLKLAELIINKTKLRYLIGKF